jgi:hypothetical protein
VPDRAIQFNQVFNFRDVGGYRAGDGRIVVRRRLFRSDDLSRLTMEDADRFAALGIRTVIDLRRPTEIAELGRVPAFTGVDYRHVHLVHPPWQPARFAHPDDRVVYLVDRYREMSIDAGDGIGTALRLVAEADTAPVVVHCIAGKDRTGIIAALTLALLGVDDDTIAADYASSEAPDRALRALLGMEPSRTPTAPAAAMLGFFAELRATHGSIEAYVKRVGLTDDHIAALRAHLLA